MLHSIRKRSKVWNSTTGGTKMNKKMMKRALTLAAFGLLMAGGMMNASAMDRAPVAASKAPAETIDASKLSNAWDKTFPEDARVSHKKVTFHNRYGITLVGDLYTPKDMKPGEKLDAIAVAGPYGAVKEQVSGRYAQELAARGFLTLAFDPSYTGESGGQPRNTTSPDIDTEDFLAAVDYLSNRPDVDPQKIGVLGICGWGGFAINAASMDPRIKATVTSTMYDMSRVIANGYFDYDKTPEQIKAEKKALREMVSAQRTLDYKNGTYKMAGGVPETVTPDMPEFVRNYHDFYQTKRGYSPRSFGSTTGAALSSLPDFAGMPINIYADEIETPVLLIHGGKAHSRYFSEDVYKKMKGNNKELLIIPGAVHTDLYDHMDVIPFAKIAEFFKTNLK